MTKGGEARPYESMLIAVHTVGLLVDSLIVWDWWQTLISQRNRIRLQASFCVCTIRHLRRGTVGRRSSAGRWASAITFS